MISNNIQHNHGHNIPRAVAMAMLPPPPTKPITLPYSVVLAGRKVWNKFNIQVWNSLCQSKRLPIERSDPSYLWAL